MGGVPFYSISVAQPLSHTATQPPSRSATQPLSLSDAQPLSAAIQNLAWCFSCG